MSTPARGNGSLKAGEIRSRVVRHAIRKSPRYAEGAKEAPREWSGGGFTLVGTIAVV